MGTEQGIFQDLEHGGGVNQPLGPFLPLFPLSSLPLPPPFPSLPLPFPFSPLPLEVGPLLRLGGLGERFSSPAGPG